MKKMLPYIVVLLVVVAAAFFFFKKKNDSQIPPDGNSDNNSSRFLDLDNTDSIIDSLSLSKDLKSKAKSWAKNIKSWVKIGDKWKSSTIQQSAESRGWTYSQALVLSALWQMYATDNIITREQYEAYEMEIDAL